MDGTKTTTNWIIAGLVALVVIIGGGWLIARERAGTMAGTETSSATTTSTTGTTVTGSASPTAAPASGKTTTVSNPTSAASGETITVMDQPAGANVLVADLTLAKPSWVVIRGTDGWALGAAWFPGSTKSVAVPLLKNTVAGQTYQAVIYIDDGDKKFQLHGGDTLVTDTQGAPVSSTFKAQ